ncbi:MAG: CDP-alcohol phosphatidyltransferase family protein [Candidatus Geothermincolia bacterium]
MSNLANIVTMLRVVVAPFFVVLMVMSNSHPGYRWIALLLFFLGAMTDFADGQIARRTNSVSKLGITLDPLADRLFIGATLITLYSLRILPLAFLVIVLGRDVLMAAGYPLIGKIDPTKVAVHWTGKAATATLFAALGLLIMSTPLMLGPNQFGFMGSRTGFSGYPFTNPSTWQFWGLWLFVIGMCWSLYSGVIYVKRALEAVTEAAAARAAEGAAI